MDLLLWVLVSTYGLGVLCGWFLRAFWVRFGIGNTRAATFRVVGPWEVLTSRALRFVRRRRAISLAFSNLRESSLRQSVQSRPNLRRSHIGWFRNTKEIYKFGNYSFEGGSSLATWTQPKRSSTTWRPLTTWQTGPVLRAL